MNFDEVVHITTFFESPLNKINQILLRMAIYIGRPEWLRGISKISDLPRARKDAPYLVAINYKNTPQQMAERIWWIVEELKGEWFLDDGGFFFGDANEALMFKMRWG